MILSWAKGQSTAIETNNDLSKMHDKLQRLAAGVVAYVIVIAGMDALPMTTFWAENGQQRRHLGQHRSSATSTTSCHFYPPGRSTASTTIKHLEAISADRSSEPAMCDKQVESELRVNIQSCVDLTLASLTSVRLLSGSTRVWEDCTSVW